MEDFNYKPEDFIVEGLENVQPAYAQFEGEMYAGMLPVFEPEHSADDFSSKKMKGMMQFWMFEPHTQSVPNTIVIWFNGGPGCSSFNCGVMMENSPVTQPLRPAGYCCLEPTPKLDFNEYAWTQATTMLYVEQPLGTGFSYGVDGYEPETEYDVKRDMYNFLQYSFYQLFPKFRDYKLFVMGESYAGMFIPSVAQQIMKQNQKREELGSGKEWMIPLGGAALGNGWIDPLIQGPATIDYSWWHGLIDEPTRENLFREWEDCLANYMDIILDEEKDNKVIFQMPFHPFNVQDECGLMWGILSSAGGVNAYDITTWDPNVDQVTFTSEAFYNRDDVKEALHAPKNITWHGCRPGGGRRRLTERKKSTRTPEERRKLLYMINDRPIAVTPFIEDLLNSDVPVLVYNGDRDMTTNMVGQELALNQMYNWKLYDHWLDAPRGLWMDSNSNSKHPEAGWVKELGGLTFAVVYNSGHMVPYNVPSPALDLVTRFVNGTTFLDNVTPQYRYNPDKKSKFKHSGVEDWMNTGPFPSVHHKYYESVANFPGWSLDRVLDTGANVTETNASVWGMSMAFFAGIAVSAVVTKFVNRANRRQRGYQQVPNAAIDG